MTSKKQNMKLMLASLVLLVAIVSCSYFSVNTAGDSSQPTGSIIYSSDESGNFEIYEMNINTYDTLRLTNNTAEDISPIYFPPGRFGFLSDKSGSYQIYTMALDGSDQKQWKPDDKRIFGAPSVSPDGTKLAYVIQVKDKDSNLYIANLDGSEEKQLTHVWGTDWDPSWSPDGKRIVYSSDSDSDWDIYVVTIDSGDIKHLTFNNALDAGPRWSPDGSRILFESDRDGDWEIYVMDVDGENVKAVTENAYGDWLPSWSPDGKWILYVSNRDGDDEINIIGFDGKNQIKLTNNSAQDRHPFWIP